jgi:hypothetical protein
MRPAVLRVSVLTLLAATVCSRSAGTEDRTLGGVARAARDGASVSLLAAGSLHGDEVPADAAGDWLALVREGNGVILWPVTVSLVPEEDIGDRNGERTGRRVEVSPPLDPIVLLRGLRPFTGEVATVILDQAVDVGEGVEASLHGVATRLVVRCVDAPAVEGQRQQRCTLSARSGAREEALFTYGAYFDGAQRLWASSGPAVLWAGDLDLDGSVDLLIDTSDHENVNEMRLFLSSAAEPGHLLSEVARLTRVGC